MRDCNCPFALYMAGTESPSWRKLMTETAGVRHIAVGFLSLRLRLPKTKKYILEERFDDKFEILVDSGGFGAERKEEYDHNNHIKLYTEWLMPNIERLSLVTEYDAISMGLDWVQWWRERFWDKEVPREKFVPIWHEEYGPAELDRLCNTYPRVGVVRPANANIEARLRNLVGRTGVKLHGVGITSPNALAKVPFTTVSSTSWLSPSKTGEIHIWSQGTIHWFPRSQAERARKTYRTEFERAGFDADLIEVEDRNEINHYSAWVWCQFEQKLAEQAIKRPQGTTDGEIIDITPRLPEQPALISDQLPKPARSKVIVVRESRKTLPGINFNDVDVVDPQGGATKSVAVPHASPYVLRTCDNCSLQSSCPEYVSGHECAFSIPARLDTMEQLQGWAKTVLEWQVQRVAMLRIGEEMQGGAPDIVLSQEMDRLFKQQLMVKELFSDGYSLELRVKGNAGDGLLSQIFGADIGSASYASNQRVDPSAAERIVASFIDVEAEPEE